MLKVILARHAETIWNEQMRYIGRTDLDLSELGQNNARLLAQYLSDSPIIEFFSSDMNRAIQTAQAVAQNFGSKVERRPLLNEIDFGVWEGLTYNQIIRRYPVFAQQWATNPYSVNIPEGEPWSVFTKRVLLGWNETIRMAAAQADEEKTVLIVTHAGCIKIILAEILGFPREKAWFIWQDKGALNHLTVEGPEIKIQKINDTDYRKEAAGVAVVPDDKIAPCSDEDILDIQFVVNKAAAAYSGFLGVDYIVDDYMSIEELIRETKEIKFFAIVRGGLLVAVAAYQPLNDVALIRHAYVLPACSRQGLAGRLLSHIEKLARLDGFKRVMVGAYRENNTAISFYEKHGYMLNVSADNLFNEYWNIPKKQAAISLVLSKDLI